MNILIFSGPDDKAAGLVAYDIAALLSNYNNVLFIGKHNPGNSYKFDIEITGNKQSQSILRKAKNKINKRKKNPDYYFFDGREDKLVNKTSSFIERIDHRGYKPDIILIIFYQNFLKSRNIKELYEAYNVPVFLYMMDYAPLTGGCHYFWNCRGFEKECGHCPALYSKKKKDQSYFNLKEKQDALGNLPVTLITGSSVDKKIAEQSTLFKDKNISTIHIPVNEKIFKPPKEKDPIKKEFDIENRFVLFCGAVNLSEKRKGGKELIAILNNLYNKFLENNLNPENLIVLQAGRQDVLSDKIPFKTKFVGYLNGQQKLSKAYQASDMFLSPSVQDSGPMMLYQATMCGVPFASFNIGLAKDMKINYQIGFVSELYDIDGFSENLLNYFKWDISKKNKYENKIREIAINNWSFSAFEKRFQKLITS